MIAQQIKSITETLPAGVRLCAVSKFHPVESLREAYDAGQRIFGESHVQELSQKVAYFSGQGLLPAVDDIFHHERIAWHFIGHLQTNKVKYLAPYVSLIHSMDSPRLFEEIARQGQRVGRDIPCLVQLHVAREETKFGFTPEEAMDFLRSVSSRLVLPHCGVSLRGVMAMASNTDDEARIRSDFRQAHRFFLDAKALLSEQSGDAVASLFTECSMGMSDDYRIALEEGSTIVRIGSTIFGPRQY